MTRRKDNTRFTIISGGGSGLGMALAKEALEHARNVIILGRDEGKLIHAAGQIKEETTDGIIIPFRCDITSQEDVDILCGFIKENGYQVDFLFNNAGTGLFGDASGNRSPRVGEILGSNLTGMILLTSALLGITPKEDAITIVNIMSTSALVGRATETVYCAAKWGARGFTEALRAELKGTNRKVVAVYPGGMNTPFWAGAKGKDLSGFMDPADVAGEIAHAVFTTRRMMVTEMTINRP
ncbi:MAG: SDR family NAD(P)-dependent oxidoreductase [Bacteroidales bacterium]|nr:SDR family NAD(P)-dependent oxidoreductase [Bacteroidales bacterium]